MQLSFDLSVPIYRPKNSVYIDYLPIKRPYALKRYAADCKIKPKGKLIYFLFNKNVLVYAGSTARLASRLRRHRHNGKAFDSFAVAPLPLYYERMIIKTFKPVLNIYLK